MPIQDLLHQAVAEHEALQSKYDEALLEISCLRTRLEFCEAPDTEFAPPPQPNLFFEPLHGVFSPEACEAHLQTVRFSETVSEKEITPQNTANRFSFLKVGSVKSTRKSSQVVGNALRDKLVRFLQNPVVESCLVLIVLTNVVVMWIETDRQAAKEQQIFAFSFLNWVYLLFYIFEFALRIFAYRRDVLQDVWTRLDFVVIVVDIASALFQAAFHDGFLSGLNVTAFRVLRVFRLLRLFKFLRFVVELQLLIHGFFGVMRAQIFAALILAIVVMLWSFVFVEVVYPYAFKMSETGRFDQCPRCLPAYSSMWNAQLTIWQQVIAGDSWGMLNLDLLTAHPHLALIFLSCFMTIQFATMNLIFTVIVDSAARARAENEQQQLIEKEMAFEKMKKKLLQMCKELDADESGLLTLEELIRGHEKHDLFADTLATLDITQHDLSLVFMLMDEDRSGSVSYVEFVNALYKIKQQDQHTVLMFIKGYVLDLRYRLTEDLRRLVQESIKQSRANAKTMNDLQHNLENPTQFFHCAAPRTEDIGVGSTQIAPADSPQRWQANGTDHVAVERHSQASDEPPAVLSHLGSFESYQDTAVVDTSSSPIGRRILKKKKKKAVSVGLCPDSGVTSGAEYGSEQPQQYGHAVEGEARPVARVNSLIMTR